MKTHVTLEDGSRVYCSAKNAAKMIRIGKVVEVGGVLLGNQAMFGVARRSRRIDAEDSHTVTRTGMLYEHHMRRCLGWGGVKAS